VGQQAPQQVSTQPQPALSAPAAEVIKDQPQSNPPITQPADEKQRLIAEIAKLRERIQQLEADNAIERSKSPQADDETQQLLAQRSAKIRDLQAALSQQEHINSQQQQSVDKLTQQCAEKQRMVDDLQEKLNKVPDLYMSVIALYNVLLAIRG